MCCRSRQLTTDLLVGAHFGSASALPLARRYRSARASALPLPSQLSHCLRHRLCRRRRPQLAAVSRRARRLCIRRLSARCGWAACASPPPSPPTSPSPSVHCCRVARALAPPPPHRRRRLQLAVGGQRARWLRPRPDARRETRIIQLPYVVSIIHRPSTCISSLGLSPEGSRPRALAQGAFAPPFLGWDSGVQGRIGDRYAVGSSPARLSPSSASRLLRCCPAAFARIIKRSLLPVGDDFFCGGLSPKRGSRPSPG